MVERRLRSGAKTVGVSKSSICREFQEASEEVLKELGERRFEEKDIVVIWTDGMIFGGHHVLAALGADDQETCTAGHHCHAAQRKSVEGF